MSRQPKKKIADSSMLHEAKIAYYAFDAAILFASSIGPAVAKATWRHYLSHFIDRVAARTCCAVNVLTSRISFLFSWPWWMKSVVKHNMLKENMLGSSCEVSIFLSEFNRMWSFLTYFCRSPKHQSPRNCNPWEPNWCKGTDGQLERRTHMRNLLDACCE